MLKSQHSCGNEDLILACRSVKLDGGCTYLLVVFPAVAHDVQLAKESLIICLVKPVLRIPFGNNNFSNDNADGWP